MFTINPHVNQLLHNCGKYQQRLRSTLSQLLHGPRWRLQYWRKGLPSPTRPPCGGLIFVGAARIWDQHWWNWIKGGLKEQLHGEFLPMGQSCLLVGKCCVFGWIVGTSLSCAPPKQTLMTVCLYLAHNGAIFWPSAVRKVRKVTTADVTVHTEATLVLGWLRGTPARPEPLIPGPDLCPTPSFLPPASLRRNG